VDRLILAQPEADDSAKPVEADDTDTAEPVEADAPPS
jgi:hypothetical protein